MCANQLLDGVPGERHVLGAGVDHHALGIGQADRGVLVQRHALAIQFVESVLQALHAVMLGVSTTRVLVHYRCQHGQRQFGVYHSRCAHFGREHVQSRVGTWGKPHHRQPCATGPVLQQGGQFGWGGFCQAAVEHNGGYGVAFQRSR